MNMEQAGAIVLSRLEPGERLLLHGAGRPGSQAGAMRYFWCFFTMLWAGFSAHGFIPSLLSAQTATNLTGTEVAFAFLFVLGVIALVDSMRRLANNWRTAYALTDRRLLIVTGKMAKTKSYAPDQLNIMERTGDEARGTVRFDYGDSGDGCGFRAGLYGIEYPARCPDPRNLALGRCEESLRTSVGTIRAQDFHG